jgi:hypothetical protein
LSDQALDLPRRIEPALQTIRRDIGELRADVRLFQQEIASLSRAIVGACALLFAALHVWPPHG